MATIRERLCRSLRVVLRRLGVSELGVGVQYAADRKEGVR